MKVSRSLLVSVILLSGQLSCCSEVAELRPELTSLRRLGLSKEAGIQRQEPSIDIVLAENLLTKQELKNIELSRAIASGDVDAVRAAVVAGANVNIEANAADEENNGDEASSFDSDDHEHSPLIDAVDNGNLEIIKLLLAAGADVDFMADCSATALSTAVNNGNLEIIKLLLAAGADINEGRSSITALDRIEDSINVLKSYDNNEEGISRYQEIKKFLVEKGAKRAADLAAEIAPILPRISLTKEASLSQLERELGPVGVVGVRNPNILDID